MQRRSLRPPAPGGVLWLLAVLGTALVVGACGDGGQSQGGDYPAIEIPADPEQASPATAPGDPDPEAATGGTYAPFDLGFLGPNASASEIPSAVPAGLEVGFTVDGFPYRGSADAPVTLVEYSDYACPLCGRHTAQSAPTLLADYAATGRVRFVFREFPLVGLHPTAPVAHTAAVCAGEQSAELYWAVHDEIYARQADWTSLPDPTEFLAGLATDTGVDVSVFQECVDSGRAAQVIGTAVAEAEALGFNGTPSFQLIADGFEDSYKVIGAQPLEVFQGYLGALIAGEVPAGAQAAQDPGEEPAGVPLWADRENGLQPDPDRPGVNLAGDHYRGDPDAPIVVVEFSDFECPFCAQHALQVQPEVDEALVHTGQVLWVFKHLPLEIYPSAPAAAVAAECAGDQEQFWQMHDLLFESVAQWAGEGVDTDAALVGLAGDLKLDRDVFEQCLAGREALERVLADLGDARGIISSTPSFIVLRGDQATLLEGAMPAEQFLAALRELLAAETGG
jgi:protein-disulfide isomerase